MSNYRKNLFDDCVFPSASELASMLGLDAVPLDAEVHDAIAASLEEHTAGADNASMGSRDGLDRGR